MFVHLHTHSHFSIKDAVASPLALAKRAAAMKMPAVALTDHNTLAGAIRFYTACQENGVKPIIGCEVDLKTGQSLVLLAKDMSGYSNLCNLLTSVNLAAPKAKFAITPPSLIPFGQGLFCLMSGEILPLADISVLRQAFPGSLYIELQNPRTRTAQDLLRRKVALAKQLELPLVATNNVHFIEQEDHLTREVLVAIGENLTTVGASSRSQENAELFFKNNREMALLFKEHPQALEATEDIADNCNLTLPLGQFHFPYFTPPKGKDSSIYLEELCREGMNRLYSNSSLPEKRLAYELGIIRDLGFVEYFLVVWDIVNFARREGIRHSCRGSAAGSLVSYTLGLTAIDPIEHELLFERFLNPERKGMPDIDMDFDSARRDEVLAYVYNRYEQDKVAMVGTVNTFNARSSIRDVSKSLGFTKAETDRLAKYIPHTSAGRLGNAIDNLPELKGFPRSAKYRKMIELCMAIDGCPRHLSVHAGGVVISRDKLTDLVPLQWSAKGVVITQYDKDDLEIMGLVKIDLLGLRILSAIESTRESLAKDGIMLNVESLPLDDADTYKMLRSTHTVGVFQLESPGMRELLGRLQPTVFADIIANIALFRPGPMQANMITPFLARRHGLEEPDYVHPCLIPVLKETYGVIVFQEQVLQVASRMGQFTLGQGDILRRTMTKDCPPQKLQELEADFIRGAAVQGVGMSEAKTVFRQLAAFAAYGFNKAHAATFGLIAYQTAYLKTHYPAHFYAGLLNHQPMGFYPANTVLHDARNRGIKLLPPSIIHSQYHWIVEAGGLRMGLKDVGGMNRESYEAICSARQENLGSMDDILNRMPLPMRAWQSLLAAGALDELGARSEWERCIKAHNRASSTQRHTQCSFLSHTADKQENPPAQVISIRERLYGEFRSTGMCYSGHPMETVEEQIPQLRVTESSALPYCPDGQRVKVAGMVVSRQTPPTRSKQRIIFLTLEDRSGLIDVAIFADAQKEGARAALGGGLLLVEGTLRKTGVKGVTITANKVQKLQRDPAD